MFRTFDEVKEMATHASAEKAARQAIRKNKENLHTRSKYKAVIKQLRLLLGSKPASKDDARKEAQVLLTSAQRLLAKAASKNVIKRKTASRYVSRLSASVHRSLGA